MGYYNVYIVVNLSMMFNASVDEIEFHVLCVCHVMVDNISGGGGVHPNTNINPCPTTTIL